MPAEQNDIWHMISACSEAFVALSGVVGLVYGIGRLTAANVASVREFKEFRVEVLDRLDRISDVSDRSDQTAQDMRIVQERHEVEIQACKAAREETGRLRREWDDWRRQLGEDIHAIKAFMRAQQARRNGE